jgi:cytochrome P450 family 6
MKGDKWKYVRSKMAPAFTTGKIKAMFPLILEVCEELRQNLQRRIDAEDCEFDAHSLCAEYTTDVVASCAFGIKSDSLRQTDNQFRKMGKELFEPSSFLRQMELMVVFTLPKIAEILGCKFISTQVEVFFKDLITKAFEYREKHAEFKRNDFINLLMQLKKLGSVNIEESDKEMSASINEEFSDKSRIGKIICLSLKS